MEARISMITLGVTDLERSREFYEYGLGFPVRPESVQGEVVFFDLEGTWLALFGRDELAQDTGVAVSGPGFSGVALGHVVGNEQAVNDVLAHVERIGGRIVKPGRTTFWGGYSGYFADPDGFLWEVACDTGLPLAKT